MKRIYIQLAVLFLLMAFSSRNNAQVSNDDLSVFIDSMANSEVDANGPGMAVLVAKNGEAVYRNSFGMADVELSVSMSPDNVFAIGSMTKQITSVCILQLEDAGKLDINDDIRKYLPDYNSHGRVITIENCMQHTGGIPSFTELSNFNEVVEKTMTGKELIEFFQDDSLLFEPGTDYSYSNSGYYLLGQIIEKVSGITYEEYVRKNIFDKIGMDHSYFDSMTNIIPKRASGYDGQGGKFENASYYSRTWTKAAGDIMSTVDDMLIWDNALQDGLVVSSDLLQKAWTPYMLPLGLNTNYGYGWNVLNLNGNTVIEHGGAINGYLTNGIRVPELGLYIIAMTNYTGRSPVPFTHKILQRLTGFGVKPEVISINKEKLNDYQGSFEMTRDGGRLIRNYTPEKMYRYIFVEGDSLKLIRTGGPKVTLLPFEDDKFFAPNSDRRFDFVRDASGKVIALDVYDYPINSGPHDICYKVDVSMPSEKQAVSVSFEDMKKIEGVYEFQPGFELSMFIEDGNLYTQATGQKKIRLYPESNLKYFMKEVDASIEAIPDPDGKINKIILNQGQTFECKRKK